MTSWLVLAVWIGPLVASFCVILRFPNCPRLVSLIMILFVAFWSLSPDFTFSLWLEAASIGAWHGGHIPTLSQIGTLELGMVIYGNGGAWLNYVFLPLWAASIFVFSAGWRWFRKKDLSVVTAC